MLKRLWVIGLVTLTALMSTALPARAAEPDLEPANRAGAWLATQLVDGHLPGTDPGSEFGGTALALIGMAATDDPALKPSLDAMTAYLKANGPAQGAASSRAAALAIAADALDLAPDAFGVDPVAAITADTQADGSVGSWASAYGQGFAMIALARADSAPTDPQVAWLVAQQDESGAFGYLDQTGAFVADPDSTAMALMGLSVVERQDATEAADRAADWLEENRAADGSWQAASPVNTTALAGMALAARDVDVASARAWVVGQQGDDGGLLFGGAPDAYATSQALVFLAGANYTTVARPQEAGGPGVPLLATGGVLLLAIVVAGAFGLGKRR